ncbi:MAG: Ig domain-containing protein [Candidatus Woesearchaeota archaeon]|nr:Ig domain-containing protein [Candidatus Woesearchaeota archaeon]
MDQKKGQISLFIILGIILLIIASLWFYYQRVSVQKPTAVEAPTDIKAVQEYVEQCIKKITPPGVYLLAYQGGRMYTDKDFQQDDFTEKNFLTFERAFPYYLLNGKKVMPSRSDIEKELGAYVAENLPLCVDFSGFAQQGMAIAEGDVTAKTTIARDRVIVDVTYPLEIIVKDKVSTLSKFSAEVPSRAFDLLAAAEKMLGIITKNPERANLPAFAQLNSQYTVMISLLPFDKETMVYSMYDDDEKFWVDNAPLIWWFGVSETRPRKDATGNSAPRILNLKDFVLRRSVPFTYDVDAFDADNDAVSFTSNNPSIPITSDGLFSFTPINIGTFTVKIKATDTHGSSDERSVRFVVED